MQPYIFTQKPITYAGFSWKCFFGVDLCMWLSMSSNVFPKKDASWTVLSVGCAYCPCRAGARIQPKAMDAEQQEEGPCHVGDVGEAGERWQVDNRLYRVRFHPVIYHGVWFWRHSRMHVHEDADSCCATSETYWCVKLKDIPTLWPCNNSILELVLVDEVVMLKTSRWLPPRYELSTEFDEALDHALEEGRNTKVLIKVTDIGVTY